MEVKQEYITERFEVEGFAATVILPPKPNGKWLWKTEFFYAFDALERELCARGYTRVYYAVSDRYGSPKSIELMYKFYRELLRRYPFLNEKGYIIGFSRGGMYAFNFTIAHPECVKKAYFDAPVLDLRTWPRKEEQFGERRLREQVAREYGFASDYEYEMYDKYPVDCFDAYFRLKIPTLLVAGDADKVVDFSANSQKMISYCIKNNIEGFRYYVKHGADHHPHSFGNVSGEDCERAEVYSSEIAGSSLEHLCKVENDEKILIPFFEDENNE